MSTKKFLKTLNFDDARQLIFQNKDLAVAISGDVWDAARINGQRLTKIGDGNDTIISSCKEKLKLSDEQMKILVEHVKANNPEATLSNVKAGPIAGGAKPAAAAAATAAAIAPKPAPGKTN